MGFLDKVKEVGNQAASSVNQAVNKGQQQLEEQKSRKHTDALLRDLGALTFRRETGRADGGTDAAVSALVAQLTEAESAGQPVDLEPRAGSASPVAGAATPSEVAPPPAPGTVAPPPAPGTVAPPPPPGVAGGQ